MKKKETPKQKVKRMYPHAGAELSAMHGWRIVDYTVPGIPAVLNRGCKTEAAAWRSIANRHG